MKLRLTLAVMATALLTACSGSDINIQPTTIDNSQDNSQTTTGSSTSTTNPCASYMKNGQTIAGQFNAPDCDYAQSFVAANNRLSVDLTIPSLSDGGVHIFRGSLFVGETYDSTADATAAGITEGGDGPTLTIEPGVTLAFPSSQQFMVINRGSRLLAAGTAISPITITSLSDIESQRADSPTLAFDAVQQWGGMVINGFGVTNKCEYTGTRGTDLTLVGDCDIEAEGAAGVDTSHYGGNNDADNSGILQYVVIKHTGAEVANGDELNGITFGAVGSGTQIDHLQIYSTYDDGIEMFGGAVNFTNFVGLYARDDTIDIDEGYQGTITNALVIQNESDGNRCIEADGIGSYGDVEAAGNVDDFIARGLNSRPTINNLTCIFSTNETGTHDPGAGMRLREGLWPTINDSLFVGSFGESFNNDNYCIRVNADNERVAAAFEANDAAITASILACELTHRGSVPGAGTEMDVFLSAPVTVGADVINGSQFATVADAPLNATAAADTDLQLLEGTPPIYSIDFATMQVDGAAPTATAPASGRIGALTTGGTDFTAGWTYGIHADNRGAPLWFE